MGLLLCLVLTITLIFPCPGECRRCGQAYETIGTVLDAAAFPSQGQATLFALVRTRQAEGPLLRRFGCAQGPKGEGRAPADERPSHSGAQPDLCIML